VIALSTICSSQSWNRERRRRGEEKRGGNRSEPSLDGSSTADVAAADEDEDDVEGRWVAGVFGASTHLKPLGLTN